jgi:hypothetical protein
MLLSGLGPPGSVCAQGARPAPFPARYGANLNQTLACKHRSRTSFRRRIGCGSLDDSVRLPGARLKIESQYELCIYMLLCRIGDRVCLALLGKCKWRVIKGSRGLATKTAKCSESVRRQRCGVGWLSIAQMTVLAWQASTSSNARLPSA